jgi:hypothetical protein
MGTKAALTYLRSPPPLEREDNERPSAGNSGRSTAIASVGEALDVLRVLDFALGQTDDAELGALVTEIREGERAFEQWARQVESFRTSKVLFDAGILPDPVGRPRGIPDELVLDRLARTLDASSNMPWLLGVALAAAVGFVFAFLIVPWSW